MAVLKGHFSLPSISKQLSPAGRLTFLEDVFVLRLRIYSNIPYKNCLTSDVYIGSIA